MKKQITKRGRPSSSSSSLLYIFNGSEDRNDIDARKDRSEQPSLRHKTWSTLNGGKAKKGERQRGHQWQGWYSILLSQENFQSVQDRMYVRMLAINVRYELFSKVEIRPRDSRKKKEKKRDKRGYFEPQEGVPAKGMPPTAGRRAGKNTTPSALATQGTAGDSLISKKTVKSKSPLLCTYPSLSAVNVSMWAQGLSASVREMNSMSFRSTSVMTMIPI